MSQDLLNRRRAAIDDLSDAFSEHDMPLDEFERRLALAHRAESDEQLKSALQGVTTKERNAENLPARATIPAQKTVTSVLGSTRRAGPLGIPKEWKVRSIFGSTELDLRDAQLQPGVTELKLSAVFGTVEIIVPPHMSVLVNGSAVLGTFEHVERAPASVSDTESVLHITGLACFASVDITTKLPDQG